MAPRLRSQDLPSDEEDALLPDVLAALGGTPIVPDDDQDIPDIAENDNNEDARLAPQSQRFANILAKAMGEAVTQALVAAPLDPAKYPKAKDPGMFNGRKRRYLRTWIGENEICFRTAPNLYRAEISKVMFAGSFLEGDAKTWFTDYFHDPANIPAFMSDWTLFTIELQRNFGLEDELGAAEEDLGKLTMADKDRASYFTARFRAIMSNLGGTWDDRNLRNQYYKKLAPRLRTQFVTAGTPVPSKLEPLIFMVDRFDRAYWADYELNRTINSTPAAERNSSSTDSAAIPAAQATRKNAPAPSAPRAALSKPFPAAHLTKEGKLTPEEKQRRMDAGACFYCGEVGHLTAQCSKKGQPRARAVTDNAATPQATAPSSVSTPSATALPRAPARIPSVVLNESDDSGND